MKVQRPWACMCRYFESAVFGRHGCGNEEVVCFKSFQNRRDIDAIRKIRRHNEEGRCSVACLECSSHIAPSRARVPPLARPLLHSNDALPRLPNANASANTNVNVNAIANANTNVNAIANANANANTRQWKCMVMAMAGITRQCQWIDAAFEFESGCVAAREEARARAREREIKRAGGKCAHNEKQKFAHQR